MLTPKQSKAARALLDWSLKDLRAATGDAISVNSLNAFEKGGEMRKNNQVMLRGVFEGAGIVFQDPNGGGSGARLAENETLSANSCVRDAGAGGLK